MAPRRPLSESLSMIGGLTLDGVTRLKEFKLGTTTLIARRSAGLCSRLGIHQDSLTPKTRGRCDILVAAPSQQPPSFEPLQALACLWAFLQLPHPGSPFTVACVCDDLASPLVVHSQCNHKSSPDLACAPGQHPPGSPEHLPSAAMACHAPSRFAVTQIGTCSIDESRCVKLRSLWPMRGPGMLATASSFAV